MKKSPRFVGSAPIVWKIRLICDDCSEKAMLTPQKPNVIANNVFNGKFGREFEIRADFLVAAPVALVAPAACAVG